MVSHCQSKKMLQVRFEDMSKKTFNFNLEVKGQRRIGIMNVRDTLSHGDGPMCQIWLANVKAKKC